MAFAIARKSATVALLVWLCHAAQGKRMSMQSLTTFLKAREVSTTPDPYRIAGNAAVEENAADVPMDHTTAITYVLSFCVILAAICVIFAITVLIRYRKRRRAQGPEKVDGGANWEKIGTQELQGARDRFKRMGLFHPSTACLRQLDARLPCRCPLCIAAEEATVPDLDSRANTRPTETVTSPPDSGRAGTFPRRPRNNENAFAGLVRTRPAQPVSPHEHEWTLFHGSSPALAGSGSMPIRAGPELTPIEPARLSQMSPLSSLRSSLIHGLERPPLLSDDSGLSTIKVVNTPKGEDVKGSPLAEGTSMTVETFTAFKLIPEMDLSNKNAWISDADWVLANEPVAQPLAEVDLQEPCCASVAKTVARPPLAKVER
ncbi:uncharacterized protein C8Q71DRAFT_879243 [Rhodofomes roseus]|uniref:Uncharacterized protein n=1 Tax=Rhodofomes roseus TaxID=34475 RepID=A0ABQ8K5Y4_9APHY|nr:uncharacterized protein C8Q71DRAFT_879243 [Rhodofomes roseus]KAH9832503.1 hypothetical protein C8Q71DRAFT_879243 [Rhodofomes roseus]